jgi:hypothetical protein
LLLPSVKASTPADATHARASDEVQASGKDGELLGETQHVVIGGDETVPGAFMDMERLQYLPVIACRQTLVDVPQRDELHVVLEVSLERHDDRLGKVLIEREEVRHARDESGRQAKVWLKFALQVQRVLDIGGLDRGVERRDLADAQAAALKSQSPSPA